MEKWVLITGASSGIGKSVTEYLDSCGYRMILVARSEERLNKLAAGLANAPLVVIADLQKIEAVSKIFSVVEQNNIKLDGLVHCAGLVEMTPIQTNEIARMTEIMNINCFILSEMMKYFGRKKYSNNDSAVIAISSLSAKTCYGGTCSYSASKAALNASVKVMAKEYMKRKIRVNAILPATVDTPMGPDPNDPYWLEKQPLGVIEPIYVAYMVEYLLSEKAKYMTGELITMSGGMTY